MTIFVYACDDCGRPSPWWLADEDLWSSVMGVPRTRPTGGGYMGGGKICPSCFILRSGFEAIDYQWRLTVTPRRPMLDTGV